MADFSGLNSDSVHYDVTPHYVHQAALDTHRTAEEIAHTLHGIRTYVINLENHWQGIAQQTFQELMAEYDVYAKMLNDALNDISSGLNGTYVNYTESEQTNINNLKSIDSQLPTGFNTVPYPDAHLAPDPVANLA